MTSDPITEQAAADAIRRVPSLFPSWWTSVEVNALAGALATELLAAGLLDMPERIARAIEAEHAALPMESTAEAHRGLGLIEAARIARTFASSSAEAPAARRDPDEREAAARALYAAGDDPSVLAASRVLGWRHLTRFGHQDPEWMDSLLRAMVRAALAHQAPATEPTVGECICPYDARHRQCPTHGQAPATEGNPEAAGWERDDEWEKGQPNGLGEIEPNDTREWFTDERTTHRRRVITYTGPWREVSS